MAIAEVGVTAALAIIAAILEAIRNKRRTVVFGVVVVVVVVADVVVIGGGGSHGSPVAF